jgi:hypothetical protein
MRLLRTSRKMKIRLTLIAFTFQLVLVNGQTFKPPVIIDSLKVNKEFVEVRHLISWQRIPFYIGPLVDTIVIGRFYHDVRAPIRDHFSKATNEETEKQFTWLPDSSLEFYIQDKNEVTLQEYEEDAYLNFKALPVFIRNRSDSTIIAGYGYDIPVVIEAIDNGGSWRPIEERYFYDCGVGLRYILLKPQNVACLLIPKYKGRYKTSLRLKLKNNYSKPFKGTINIEQFDKRSKN